MLLYTSTQACTHPREVNKLRDDVVAARVDGRRHSFKLHRYQSARFSVCSSTTESRHWGESSGSSMHTTARPPIAWPIIDRDAAACKLLSRLLMMKVRRKIAAATHSSTMRRLRTRLSDLRQECANRSANCQQQNNNKPDFVSGDHFLLPHKYFLPDATMSYGTLMD